MKRRTAAPLRALSRKGAEPGEHGYFLRQVFSTGQPYVSCYVWSLRRAIYALVPMLIVFSLITSAAAQTLPINVVFHAESLPLPIGRTTPIMVVVTDVVNSTAQLNFVGLRFEWNKPHKFFIGGNSDKGAVLAAGQQITYLIPVDIPDNVTPGTYNMSAYVTYHLFEGGSWTGTLASWWVSEIQLAYPQTQQSQAATVVGPQQTFNLRSIAILVAAVALGLLLVEERHRIGRLIGRGGGTRVSSRYKGKALSEIQTNA